jgi:hypothetical protein
VANCGWCCPRFSLDYFEDSVSFREKYPGEADKLQQISVEINGKPGIYYSIPQRELRGNNCGYLDMESRICKIHDSSPYTCRKELLKIFCVEDRGFIMKKPYGHGWIIRNGVPAMCVAKPFNPKALVKDIGIILELGRIGDRFGIETYCNHIARILDKILESGRIPNRSIVVNEGDLGNWIGEDPLQIKTTEVGNMAEKVLKAGITREKGWLYFIDKAGDVSRARISKKAEKPAKESKKAQ